MEPTITTKSKMPISKIALPILGVIVLCGLSFWGGAAYGKNGNKSDALGSAQSSRFGGLGSPGGMRQGGEIGSATAVSDTSLTVKNLRTGESKSYTINSTTTVSDNGTDSAVSNIKTGNTVLVEASSSDSSVASRIILNPSFGGSMGPGSQSSTNTEAQTN